MSICRISDEAIRMISEGVETPFWIYNSDEIMRRLSHLDGFDVIRYAQKANSNIHILSLLRKKGVVVDAVSSGEIDRALAAGYEAGPQSSDIVYASDILDQEAARKIVELDIPVNIGSPQMLSQIGEINPGHRVWLRINPGFGSGFSNKTNTGGENSKHGIWHENIAECYELIKRYKLKLAGLHMHIGSGADFAQLERVCSAMHKQVVDCPFDVEGISTGGGLPIPYRPEEKEIDIEKFHGLWAETRKSIETHLGHKISLEVEPGRYIVGNSGYLISQVRAKKGVGENRFVLVDAGFTELMRPAMYGSHHNIKIISKNGTAISNEGETVVAGPLCEAGDVFTQREGGIIVTQTLGDPEIGDLLVFEDCGAYSSSMSSNYNSRPLAPEFLFEEGSYRQIRKRQNFSDLLSLETSCPGLG